VCQVTGRPPPVISWFHNDTNIDGSKDFVVSYNKETGQVSLGITDCLPDDEGLFKCTAKNIAGHCNTECMLTVLPVEAPPLSSAMNLKSQTGTYGQSQSKLTKKTVKSSQQSNKKGIVSGPPKASGKQEVQTFPRFTQPLQPCVSHEGKTFVLEAVVVGIPEPEIVWLKDREVLMASSGRHAAMFDRITGTCSLMVQDAFPSDVGVYSCRATNLAGRAMSTANVVIVRKCPIGFVYMVYICLGLDI